MVMKRFSAPTFWPVERKTKKYIIQPRPGPHAAQNSIPLGIIIRDILKHAFTKREAKKIAGSGMVLVDGRIRKDIGFPVGLMDVITVGDENYRVLVNRHGLNLVKIDKRESSTKLLRLEGKNQMKKGKLQAHFHDGKNILLDSNMYKTGDVAIFDIDSNSVKETMPLGKGSKVLVIRGNNKGTLGEVEDVIVTKSTMPNQVVVNIGVRKIALPQNYVFVVGRNQPVITIGDKI